MISSSPAEILSILGHELRGPVNGVLGFAALLHSTPLSQEQREYLDHLHLSAQSLLSQVNLIFDLARLENNTLELEPSSVSFVDLIEESILIARRETHDKAVQWDQHIDASIPTRIRVDRHRVQQITSYLLANVSRYSRRNTIRISAFLSRILAPSPPLSEHATHQLSVEISDTGPGIPQEFHPQVLKAFQRGNTASLRRTNDMGAGLILCRKLVHLMGGQIGFDSTPQPGTRFWFSLPLRISPSSEDETACILPLSQASNASFAQPTRAHPSDSPHLPHAPPQKARVLIIEDNAATARYLKQAITRLGCEASLALSIAEARTFQDQTPFDVILLDTELHGEDGLVLAPEFTATNQNSMGITRSRIPTLIALSHETISQDRQQALLIQSVLLKPLNTAQLLEVVQHGLRVRMSSSRAS